MRRRAGRTASCRISVRRPWALSPSPGCQGRKLDSKPARAGQAADFRLLLGNCKLRGRWLPRLDRDVLLLLDRIREADRSRSLGGLPALVPGHERVLAGRNVLDLEFAVVASDRVVGVVGDVHD